MDEETPADPGRLPRNVWILTAGSFLTDVSSEMLVHLIPLFLANVLGARGVTIGLIEGLAETTSSGFKVLSGFYSDHLRRRKWLTVAGYALSTLAKPWLAVASQAWQVLAIRFAERSGKGIRTAPRDALIADSIVPAQRGLAFGLHRAGDTAGAALGILIALIVVLRAQGSELLLTGSVFKLLVWISVVPAALAVIVLAAGLREVVAKSAAPAGTAPAGRFSSSFYRFLAVMGLFTLGNSADAFLVLRAQDLGLSVAAVLGLLLALNIVYALGSTPAGRLSDRIGRRRLLLAGWLLYAAVYFGLALARSTAAVVVLFLAYGVYNALSDGSGKAFVADLVPADRRGGAYGLYHAVIALSALPASLLAGLLWQGIGSWPGFGLAAPFYAGGLLALLAVVALRTVSLLPPVAAPPV